MSHGEVVSDSDDNATAATNALGMCARCNEIEAVLIRELSTIEVRLCSPCESEVMSNEWLAMNVVQSIVDRRIQQSEANQQQDVSIENNHNASQANVATVLDRPLSPLPLDDAYRDIEHAHGLVTDVSVLPPRSLDAPLSADDVDAVQAAMADFALNYRPSWANDAEDLSEIDASLLDRVTTK